jgi:2-dehydro-3-deoxyphosphogluconate aldolase/(4S)-4-hydroxy-2-oxoglutarate aldolase
MDAFPETRLQRLQRARVVAGFSVDRAEDAVPIVKALLAGGLDTIELTLRTDSAIDAVRAIHEEVPEIFLGVGTLLTPGQVAAVKSAGADFGVSPGMNPRVIGAAREAALPFAPGICTPTDLEAAIEQGCRLVKFFPAEASGGLAFLKSMAAPYKHLGIRFFPLGGLNSGNMMDYLGEDIVAAIGGSWIVRKELVDAGDWTAIRDRASAVSRILQNSTN